MRGSHFFAATLYALPLKRVVPAASRKAQKYRAAQKTETLSVLLTSRNAY
jgi:hypothetical protein